MFQNSMKMVLSFKMSNIFFMFTLVRMKFYLLNILINLSYRDSVEKLCASLQNVILFKTKRALFWVATAKSTLVENNPLTGMRRLQC